MADLIVTSPDEFTDSGLPLKERYVDQGDGTWAQKIAGTGGSGTSATQGLGAYQTVVLQNAAAATGNGTSINLSGMGTMNVAVTGTFVGTVTFEAQDASGAWNAVLVQIQGSTSLVSSTTTTGVFRCPIGGYSAFRARVSAYTSGAITATAFAENTAYTPAIQNVSIYEKLDATNDSITTYPLGHSVNMVSADTLIKTGAGVLHTVTFTCNDAAPTAGSIIGYDNVAESGTVLFNHTFTTTPFVPTTIVLDVAFATGLYIGFTTTADVNVTVSWR
jgi:hypothetical protein